MTQRVRLKVTDAYIVTKAHSKELEIKLDTDQLVAKPGDTVLIEGRCPVKPYPTSKRLKDGPPKDFDSPACCDSRVENVIHWYKGRWVHEMDSGGPGQTREDLTVQVFFCPFCGARLDGNTPLRKI